MGLMRQNQNYKIAQLHQQITGPLEKIGYSADLKYYTGSFGNISSQKADMEKEIENLERKP